MTRRWLFADQLGPHFLDRPDQAVLLVESTGVFRRRAFHRQKAHLVLSALRHRARELGDQAVLARAETYRSAVADLAEPLDVCHPTSRAALSLVRSLPGVEVLAARGFATGHDEFAAWAGASAGPPRMASFYRYARRRLDVLMVDGEPAGGAWSFDADNREPPPRGVDRLDLPAAPLIHEDDIDDEVRWDLNRWERDGIRFVGRDGPRTFPATRAEALARLRHFVRHRLPMFGPYEDAMLAGDPMLAHSGLSACLNLGLLHPLEAVRLAEEQWHRGAAPLSSVEGFCRQLIGWRDYVWNLYWHLPADYGKTNRLRARTHLPAWFSELDADAVSARCLADVLAGVRDRGWVHHIPRLMVLGNYAQQRGWRPAEVADWFHRSFVDGYEWVMAANVIGMSQYADLGELTTKPYAAGGAYLNRMSDYCRGCRYRPGSRAGDDACPFTGGYWWFLSRNRDILSGNPRLSQAMRQLERLADIEVVVQEQSRRGGAAP